MTRAIWNGVVLAESEQVQVVDATVRWERLRAVEHTSAYRWKGTASCFDVMVDSEVNPRAAWTYSAPKDAARNIAGRVGFWKGVRIEPPERP